MNSPLRWSISKSFSFTRRYVPETGHENYQPLGNICRVTSETFFFLWWYIADLNWKTFSKDFRKNTKFQELYLAYNCTCRLSSQLKQPRLEDIILRRSSRKIFFQSYYLKYRDTFIHVPLQLLRTGRGNFYDPLFNDIVAGIFIKHVYTPIGPVYIGIKIDSLLNKTTRLKIRNQFNRFSKPPSRWISRRGDKTIRFDSALLLHRLVNVIT